MQKRVEEFIRYLQVKGFKRSTIEGKSGCVRHFVRYSEEHSLPLLTFGVPDAQGFKEYLVIEARNHAGVSYSVSTVNNYLTAVRVFFDYLRRTKQILSNPFESVSNVKNVRLIHRSILTVEQTRTLLKGALTLPTYLTAIFYLLYGSGCRIDEIRTLKTEDLHLDEGYLVFRDDKSRQDRICVLPDVTVLVLRKLELESPFVFGNRTRSGFSKYVNKYLKKLCTSLDLPVISCHAIRHTLATQLLKNRADIRIVQDILGHKCIKSSEVYTKVCIDDLHNELSLYHPREAV